MNKCDCDKQVKYHAGEIALKEIRRTHKQVKCKECKLYKWVKR